MSVVTIHTLSPDQWHEYKAIRLRALKAEPQAFCSTLETVVQEPDTHWRQKLEEANKGSFWVYFAKHASDGLVGMVGGFRDDHDKKHHSAQIFGTYVDAGHRGKGTAKNLMMTVLGAFEKDPDIHTAIVEVNIDQLPAKKLYESSGFAVIEVYELALGDGKKHKVAKMEKKLKR